MPLRPNRDPIRAARRRVARWLAAVLVLAGGFATGAASAATDAAASATVAPATESTAPASPAAAAAREAASALGAGLEQQVRALALRGMPAGATGAPRFEVSIGELDPRLRLAPCERIEPDLPAGARLWGRSRIGLRCLQGTVHWKVYLPITVKAFGAGLVATTALPAGSVLSAADLARAEVDWAEDASASVADATLAVGRTLARPLRPGQSLRESHLKARQYFNAGDTVTVFARGAGFSVAGEAQALNNGVEGQPVRVRTAAGRVLSGQPVGTRRVELAL